MIANNPHLHNLERAPYEFGHIIRRLPDDFPGHVISSDERLQVEAAINHASNANYTLMNGIEAIGHMLFMAAANSDAPVDSAVLSNLGTLIRHIGVEAQFLQEQQGDLQAILARDERRAAASPARQKAGPKAAAAESAGAA